MKRDPSPKRKRTDTAARTRTSPFLGQDFASQSNLPLPNERPRLVSISGATVRMTHARVQGRNLHLMLHGEGKPLIELAGLLPERHYHTGDLGQPFLRANSEGGALLRVELRGRAELFIRPVV